MELNELHVHDTGFQLYVDMDGVLADWEYGAGQILNQPWNGSRQEDRDFWKKLHSLPDDEYQKHWATLPWLPQGKILWKYVSKFNPIILSKPDKAPKFRSLCEAGKAEWCKNNLNPNTRYIFSTEKWRMASPNAILIDDMAKNTIPFEDHGGAAILHDGDAMRTIRLLQERFNFPRR